MNDLTAELAEVVRLSERATKGKWLTNYAVRGSLDGKPEVTEFYVYSPELADDVAIASDIIDPNTDKPSEANAELIARAVNFLRTHHAELEAMARDAARYRWLRALPSRDAERAMCPNEDGGVVLYQWRELDNRVDHAMHNSAREG